jgi:hypothetical protein
MRAAALGDRGVNQFAAKRGKRAFLAAPISRE